MKNNTQNIKQFLNQLFEKEQKALAYEYRKETFDLYNQTAKEINELTGFDFIGVLPKPLSDRVYRRTEKSPLPLLRHIYKISHYKNQDHENLCTCYVSSSNPKLHRIHECFIISQANNKFKIEANYGQDVDLPQWKFYGGDNTLKLSNLGQLISIERLQEPIDDEWSMKEYKKEK